jgi:diguanylate cyclase (GGDEF)-like protein/PAS domain S-box-containing protein
MTAIIELFGLKGFIPHGYCLLWSPALLWLHAASDFLIFLAYFSIPAALIYFIKQRKEIPYPRLLFMFAGFIIACGIGHLLSALTIWIPLYWLEGWVKGFTAVISITTATMMFWVIPKALALPTLKQLQEEIQQRQLIENQLRLFENLFEMTSDCMFMISPKQDFRFVFVNAATCRHFGQEREQLLQSCISDWDPNFKTQNDLDAIWLTIKAKKGIIIETCHRLSSEIEIPVQVSANYLSYQDEEYIVGFFHNITERRLAEKNLRASAHYIHSLLAASLDPVITLTMTGKIVSVNKAMESITGKTTDQLIGSDFSTYFIKPENIQSCYPDVLEKGFIGDYNLQLQQASGKTCLDVLLNISLYYNEQINASEMLVMMRDITAQKQAHEKLQLAASVFSHAQEGIMITQKDGEIIDVNDAFTEITGYSREELLGKNPRVLSSGRMAMEAYTAMWRDLKTKGHWYGEIWNRRKNGEVYAAMENITAVVNSQDNSTQYVALISDITKIKEHQFELEHMAHFDPLTNLPNRVLLADRIQQAIAHSRRSAEIIALVFLDLDGFKVINDTYGHLVGDQLLIGVANAMQQTLREVDTLARLGGDEFVVVLINVGDIETREPLFTRLLNAAALPVIFDTIVLQVSASMGVTYYPQVDDVDADLLIRQADQAMYQAKMSGKNRYHIFDTDLDKLTRSHNESLESISRALAANEFELYYQPKVNLRLGNVVGVEALIRWQHPTKGLLAPAEFLPFVENHALSVDIGEWVINTAMNQLESWHKVGLHLPISVNISAKQLQQDGFLDCLRQLLKIHPTVKPGDMALEILETSAMRELSKISQLITDSRDMGILFSLDDFGTGYSSLTYLKRLPISQLKIDQSFVRDMLSDVDDLAIVEGVLALANAFSLEVVAEGMETTDHGEMLLQLGCDLAQGYAIARPMPAAALEKWLTTWQPDPSWVDRPSFTRANLPLLFANAEYKTWLNGVENYLANKGPKPENSNSRFGLWLANNSTLKKGNYETILTLHQALYAYAEQLIALHDAGQTQPALAGLPELHERQEALLVKLKILVLETVQSV